MNENMDNAVSTADEHEGMVQCDRCGRWVESTTDVEHDWSVEQWCDDCIEAASDILVECEHCGTLTTQPVSVATDSYWSRGWQHSYQDWCHSCVDTDAVTCDDCGELFSVEEGAVQYETWNGSYVWLCEGCHDDNWRTCEECGGLVHYDDVYYSDEDDAYYCPDCYRRHESYNLHGYSHTRGGYFWQDDGSCKPLYDMSEKDRARLYIGIELETDYNDNAAALADDVAEDYSESYVVCKKDGSLDDNGVEIVSQPMTPLFHLNSGMWERITDIVKSHNGKSHDAGTCGLHMHVSREYFDDADAVYRLDRLFSRFSHQLIKFSRRSNTYDQMRWCAIDEMNDLAEIEDVTERKREWRYKKGHNRYQAINNTNDATVEIRLWRGTLNMQTFRATLEMTAGLSIICKNMTDELADKLSWKSAKVLITYALEANGIPHDDLDAYLAEREL